MTKWEKVIVVFGVVITLTLLVRRATAKEIYQGLQVRNITGKLKKHRSKNYGRRKLEQIDNAAVHHSATNSGTPEAYARYHVDSNGWPGIGYHFVIQKDGTIYQTNDLETVSYHVSSHNTRSIGICLTGNYDTQTPPQIQLDQCAFLIAALRNKLPQPLEISGHRDFSTKTCPGNNVDMAYIKRVADASSNVAV